MSVLFCKAAAYLASITAFVSFDGWTVSLADAESSLLAFDALYVISYALICALDGIVYATTKDSSSSVSMSLLVGETENHDASTPVTVTATDACVSSLTFFTLTVTLLLSPCTISVLAGKSVTSRNSSTTASSVVVVVAALSPL